MYIQLVDTIYSNKYVFESTEKHYYGLLIYKSCYSKGGFTTLLMIMSK